MCIFFGGSWGCLFVVSCRTVAVMQLFLRALGKCAGRQNESRGSSSILIFSLMMGFLLNHMQQTCWKGWGWIWDCAAFIPVLDYGNLLCINGSVRNLQAASVLACFNVNVDFCLSGFHPACFYFLFIFWGSGLFVFNYWNLMLLRRH